MPRTATERSATEHTQPFVFAVQYGLLTETEIASNIGAHARAESVSMSVREKIVGAFEAKNLAWHAEFERAIDHLTAVGMSDALGSALFRAKYCND